MHGIAAECTVHAKSGHSRSAFIVFGQRQPELEVWGKLMPCRCIKLQAAALTPQGTHEVKVMAPRLQATSEPQRARRRRPLRKCVRTSHAPPGQTACQIPTAEWMATTQSPAALGIQARNHGVLYGGLSCSSACGRDPSREEQRVRQARVHFSCSRHTVAGDQVLYRRRQSAAKADL